jgi:hypothetical protein
MPTGHDERHDAADDESTTETEDESSLPILRADRQQADVAGDD